jgi:hypothetical protein
MARQRDVKCAGCGGPMWGSATSLPEGQAMCLPCRRVRAGRAPGERYAYTPTERVPEWHICHTCGTPYETMRVNQKYCNPECRPRKTGRHTASATERGYGVAHQKARSAWKVRVEAGVVDCCLCGYWIEPGTPWDLDHTPDRTGYRGAAHSSCNRRDGARRSAFARPALTKACATCHGGFTTIFPRQRYCSRECRPKPKPAVQRVRPQRSCVDCQGPINLGKRCTECAATHNREYMRVVMRNKYRDKVGIPHDAPLYGRTG